MILSMSDEERKELEDTHRAAENEEGGSRSDARGAHYDE